MVNQSLPYVGGSPRCKAWAEVKNRIWERDKGRCVVCGAVLTRGKHKFAVHHIDGDKTHNDFDNLVLVCPTCHAMLHDKTVDGHMFFAGKNRYGIAWRMAKILKLDRRMIANKRGLY